MAVTLRKGVIVILLVWTAAVAVQVYSHPDNQVRTCVGNKLVPLNCGMGGNGTKC